MSELLALKSQAGVQESWKAQAGVRSNHTMSEEHEGAPRAQITIWREESSKSRAGVRCGPEGPQSRWPSLCPSGGKGPSERCDAQGLSPPLLCFRLPPPGPFGFPTSLNKLAPDVSGRQSLAREGEEGPHS